VPSDPLEFVLLNGGARVLREDSASNTDATAADPAITHHVVDRPIQTHRLLSREYVQPQWVFDSFNTRALLPTLPYAPVRLVSVSTPFSLCAKSNVTTQNMCVC
jgi:pescadillo protein